MKVSVMYKTLTDTVTKSTTKRKLVGHNYQALQLQYLAFSLDPGSAQLCRARKFLRLAGICFLIGIFGSPKRTSLTTLPSLAKTADFFGPPGVLFGLL
jgi:hypothetical protein